MRMYPDKELDLIDPGNAYDPVIVEKEKQLRKIIDEIIIKAAIKNLKSE